MTIDLSLLSVPFPAEDIEWRISRSGVGGKGIFAAVLAYITARAIFNRLDDVCGPENWKTEKPVILDVNGKSAFAVGISVRVEGSGPIGPDEWVTKWDVSEPTNIEPAKGGFSGGVKRCGAQLGIGRYLYHLTETWADVSDNPPAVKDSRWHYAKLAPDKGGTVFYWKTPNLPGWALPKEPETEISEDEWKKLKIAWRKRFAPDEKNQETMRDGFERFVTSVCGEFPFNDHSTWTRQALESCLKQIQETTDPGGVSSDVPFEE